MKLSTNLTQQILNALCGKTQSSSVTIGSYENCYLALFTGEPTTQGAMELSGRGYSRIEIHDKMNQNYQSYRLGETSKNNHTRRIGNASQLSFNEAIKNNILVDADAGGRWATATHWAIFTVETGGTPIAWAPIEEPITVDTHNCFIIRAGHMELYMEPDLEYVYYGIYSTEQDFIAAIRANETVEEPSEFSDANLHRVSQSDRRITITGDVTGKFLWFAYPVDFKGVPMLRDAGTLNAQNDMDYEVYAGQQSDNAPIFKSFYVTTTVDNTKVTMADRKNAYYVYRVYGIKDSYTPCGSSQPSDWATNWKLYYTHYFPVGGLTAPTFEANKYYSYSDGAYTQLSTEPADWATNWEDYYTYNSNAYQPVTDATCPTFRSDTYFGLTAITGSKTFNVF